MTKRAAPTALTDQNWDEEQPQEERGLFSVASTNVLQSRPVLTARHQSNTSVDNSVGGSGGLRNFTGLTGSSEMPSFHFNPSSKTSSTSTETRSKIAELNKYLMEHVSRELMKDPNCNLLPVFDSYRRHYVETSATQSQQMAVSSAVPSVATGRPLSEVFQKSADTWECPTCMISNSNSVLTCVACSCAKPPTAESANVSGNSASALQFGTSAQTNGDSSVRPLSDLFKKSADKWECPTCMISNENTALTCVACDGAKPNAADSTCPQIFKTWLAMHSTHETLLHSGQGSTQSTQSFGAHGSVPCCTWSFSSKTVPSAQVKPFNISSTSVSSAGSAITSTSGSHVFRFGCPPLEGQGQPSSGTFGSSLSSSATSATTSSERGGSTYTFSWPRRLRSFNFGVGSRETVSSTSPTSSEQGNMDSSGFTFSSPLQLRSDEHRPLPSSQLSSAGSMDSDSGGLTAPVHKPPIGISFPSFLSNASKPANSTDSEEEYEPEKPESVQHVEDGAFYTVRCKLFNKANDEWKDRGTGYLYLKPCSDRTQLLVRADTATGNILLNRLLTSGMPVSRQGPNNVTIVCASSGSGDTEKPTCVLIRVKTSDMADQLYNEIHQRVVN